MNKLTEKQIAVLTFLKEYHAEHGWMPKNSEIGWALDLGAEAVKAHLLALQKKGYIYRPITCEPRCIRIIK